jgi:hypothetical protein
MLLLLNLFLSSTQLNPPPIILVLGLSTTSQTRHQRQNKNTQNSVMPAAAAQLVPMFWIPSTGDCPQFINTDRNQLNTTQYKGLSKNSTYTSAVCHSA